MATYYLVGTGNLNAASGVWATTSGGSAGTAVPTTGDALILDGNSQTGGVGYTLTVNVAISLLSFDCNPGVNGPFIGTVLHNAFSITITAGGAGAFRLASGMTYTPASGTAAIIFSNSSGTANLTTAGKVTGNISMSGGGTGVVQQQDNLTTLPNGSLTLTAGTWDCNNAGGYTLTTGSLIITGGTARTFICAGTITVGVGVGTSATVLNATTTTNLTWTKNSANMVVSQPIFTSVGIFFTNNGLPLNNLTFNSNNFNSFVNMSTSFTCTQMTVNGGWNFVASNSATITINGPSPTVWTGTPQNPIGYQTSAFTAITNIVCSTSFTLRWGVLAGVSITCPSVTATDTLMLATGTGWSSITPPTTSVLPAQLSTAIWQDLLSSSDFSTAGSVGAFLKAIGNLAFTVPAMARGTVGSSSSTTSIITSAFDPPGAAANQFANGVVVFDKTTTTTALRGQRALISASSNVATPTLTVGALTTAPVSGDTFSVV